METTTSYIDKAVQTTDETLLSPYYDPAVLLVATGAPLIHGHSASDTSKSLDPASLTSLYHDKRAYIQSMPPPSPTFSIGAPEALSQSNSKRKQVLDVRRPALPTDIINRRVVSMPENEARSVASRKDHPGMRVVSMPDYITPHLQSPVEPCISSSGSYEYYSGQQEHVQAHRPLSDTPSPPSKSHHLCTWSEQFSGALSRGDSSQESPFEEVEDRVTWVNSPPRPIPALHGPLSLPYARCPSGAEGTVIEQPDNVSRVIWGLGPDDQPYSNAMLDSIHGNPGPADKPVSRMPSQAPLCAQSKQSVLPKHHPSQPLLLTRKEKGMDGGVYPRLRTLDEEYLMPANQIATHQPYNEVSVGWTDRSDYYRHDSEVLPTRGRSSLDVQIALLGRALKASNVDAEECIHCPGGIQPLICSTTTGFSQPFSGTTIDSHADNPAKLSAKYSVVEVDRKYNQQFLQQAGRRRGAQERDTLPTPPDSSSSLWSSYFSPNHGQSVSEIDVSPHIPNNVEDLHGNIHSHDTSSFLPENKNNKSAPNMQQNMDTSSTLEKYLPYMHALSGNIHQHMRPGRSIAPPLPPPTKCPRAGDGLRSFIDARQVVTLPQSPQGWDPNFPNTNLRSVPRLIDLTQRSLWSVPEEDKGRVVASPLSRVHVQDRQAIGPSHGRVKKSFSFVGASSANQPRTPSPERDKHPTLTPTFCHVTSPVKVRLPSLKEQGHATQPSVGGDRQSQTCIRYSRKHRLKKKEKPQV
ncbi:hypothetical protein V8B97DRAFT_737674 [Scleroderma yunnanense]